MIHGTTRRQPYAPGSACGHPPATEPLPLVVVDGFVLFLDLGHRSRSAFSSSPSMRVVPPPHCPRVFSDFSCTDACSHPIPREQAGITLHTAEGHLLACGRKPAGGGDPADGVVYPAGRGRIFLILAWQSPPGGTWIRPSTESIEPPPSKKSSRTRLA